MPQPKTSLTATNPAVIAGAITLLAAFGAGCGSTTPAATMPTDNTNTPPPANNGAMAPLENTGSTGTATNAAYKDGTYNATGSYMVHAGAEQVQIGLTIKDGVVTDTTFQGTPKFPMSQRYMDMFNQNYKTMVVGKKLSEIKLGKVSGSSLTPMGFNDAVEKIKQQAATS